MNRDVRFNPVAEAMYLRVKERTNLIRPGMSRLAIERIFPQSHGGIMGDYVTIYYYAPGVKVEVPFDNFGGSIQPQNRVSGEPKIFIDTGDYRKR